MERVLDKLVFPLLLSLIIYLFSINSDFINIKAQISSDTEKFQIITERLNRIDNNLEKVKFYLLNHK